LIALMIATVPVVIAVMSPAMATMSAAQFILCP
jgi:hypothetical protein